MSTHASTVIMDGDVELANIYTHADGYPSYHGRILKEFLAGFHQDRHRVAPKYVEDVRHLGLLLIAHLAASNDLHRLAPIGSREDYTYIVSMPWRGHSVQLKVERENGDALYEGPVEKFDPKMPEDLP